MSSGRAFFIVRRRFERLTLCDHPIWAAEICVRLEGSHREVNAAGAPGEAGPGCLFDAPAIDRRRNAETVAIFRDGATGDVDVRGLQPRDDRVVG